MWFNELRLRLRGWLIELQKNNPTISEDEILERVKLVVHIEPNSKPQKLLENYMIPISDDEQETIQTLLYCKESLETNKS